MDNQVLRTDLLVLGAGPGGYVAAIYAAKKGLGVVLVDKGELGGTCLNRGCIPTKALVKAADVFVEALSAQKYGVNVPTATIDLAKVIDRKDTVTKTLVGGIKTLVDKNGVTFIGGRCYFTGTNKAIVDNADGIKEIEFKNAIIATGGKTKHLRIPGIDLDLVLDSGALLDNRTMPESLAIIGGGIIGMEFAFIYGRMGVKVDVIEFLPQILPAVDKDLSQRLYRYAKQANITITTNAKVTSIRKDDSGKAVVSYLNKDVEKTLTADLVLEAVGRIPETSNLNLDQAGVQVDPQGAIVVDKKMRTNTPGIYAIGDVTNIMQLAHVASHQALIAVENILGNDREMDYKAIPSVIFTTPKIATVGMTEAQLLSEGVPYKVTKVPFSTNGKALIMDDALGYLKIMYDETTKEILGAAVFGEDADQLIAPLTLALNNNLGADRIKDTVFAHPTTAELVHEGALGMLKEAIHFLD